MYLLNIDFKMIWNKITCFTFAPIDVILLHIICSFKAKSLLVINVDSPDRELRAVFFVSSVHVMKDVLDILVVF